MAPLTRRTAASKSKDSLGAPKTRRGRKREEKGPVVGTRHFIETGIFLAFFVLVTLICFLGQTPPGRSSNAASSLSGISPG